MCSARTISQSHVVIFGAHGRNLQMGRTAHVDRHDFAVLVGEDHKSGESLLNNRVGAKLSPRKTLKAVLRTIAYMTAGLAVIGLGGFAYLSKPHIAISEVRATGQLETIRAYWALRCAEDLLVEEGSDRELRLAVPEGGTMPEETLAAVPGNSFVVTGYRFRQIEENLLTGEMREVPSPRVDAVAWQVVTPYRIYSEDDDDLYLEANAPLGWRSPAAAPPFARLNRPRASAC